MDKKRIDIKDIDGLKKAYELPHYWALRKEFLQIHAKDFEPDRLICLSNLFVNIECLGVTYPDEVMKQIRKLGSPVKGLEVYRNQWEQDEPELPRKKALPPRQRFVGTNPRPHIHSKRD